MSRLTSIAVVIGTLPAAFGRDLYEPNNSCGAPPVLPQGVTTGLTLGPDDDYYAFAVPANALLEVRAEDGAGRPLAFTVSEVSCGAPVASALGSLRYLDCGGAARDLVLHIPSTAAPGLAYEVTAHAVAFVDDTYEPNDACGPGGASVVRAYMTAGLVVTRCDEDHWTVAVQPNQYEVQFDTLFDRAQGVVELELLDSACNLVAAGTTTAHGKSVRYVNTTATLQTVTARVRVAPGSHAVEYTLLSCFAGPPFAPLIGYQACIGVPNSTGVPAGICAWGSDVAAVNDVNLYVGELPLNSFGYFIASPWYHFVLTPGNSTGNLCLGTPGRYSYDTRNSAAGFVSYRPDLTRTPVAGGAFTAVALGERWYWQYRYRDFVGGVPTSNFSGALYVDFQ